jgi:hypothetical protein
VTETRYGVGALSFMMAMYTLEHRHRRYVAAFALDALDFVPTRAGNERP